MKVCTKCNKLKSLNEFAPDNRALDGRQSRCRKCCSIAANKKRKTKIGLIYLIYQNQRRNCKQRNDPFQTYKRKELKEWLYSQKLFHELFNNWELSNFDVKLTPSVDRIDDYKSYTLDNIKLMTWQENWQKAMSDIKNGINRKTNKAVLQYDLKNNFIGEYYSQKEAMRKTGVSNKHIGCVCKGLRKTTGGYIWKYVD